jgi:hypothetical protein
MKKQAISYIFKVRKLFVDKIKLAYCTTFPLGMTIDPILFIFLLSKNFRYHISIYYSK